MRKVRVIVVSLAAVGLAVVVLVGALTAQEARIKLVTSGVSLGKVHPGIDEGSITISLDSNHVAYEVKRGEKWIVVTDGTEGKEYDDIYRIVFSPDSKRLAYSAKRGEKEFVVVDGEEGKEYDNVRNIVFSPDGKRLTYSAKRGEKWLVIVDGEEGKEHSGAYFDWKVNPNRVKLQVKDGELSLHILSGTEISFGLECSPVFSPNGRRLAYVASREGKPLVVADGVEGKEYDDIGLSFTGSGPFSSVRIQIGNCLIFSPDSKQVVYTARQGKKWFVVVNGVETEEVECEGIGVPVFSPDSKRMAYWVVRSNGVSVVVDGKVGKTYDGIRMMPVVFGPDSKHVAYVATRGEKELVVVDGVDGKEYDEIESVIFSPNGGRVAYVAKQGEKWFIVVDKEESKEGYDNFLEDRLVFDSPDRLHGLVRRGDELLRVDVEVVKNIGME